MNVLQPVASADAASTAAAVVRLPTGAPSPSPPLVVSSMTVEEDDEKLEKARLPLNEGMQEDPPLTAEEEQHLAEAIVAKLVDPEKTMAAFDETSKVRIYRGMITNNKGTMGEKVAEAIESYQRISAWIQANPDVLTKKLKGEEVLNGAMNTFIGGQDWYGHQVWAERLGDIAGVVDHPVTPEEAKVIRMKTMEAIRAAQIVASETRGPRRYKQVYIIDLSQLSLSSLMARSSVRTMTTAIVSGANNFYPECLWKMFIVNAPFIFRSVYSMLSPFIHPVTKEKINILGGPSKYLPEMAKAGIPKSAVPKSLGGDCPDKKIDALLAELIADGFPRAAKAPVA